jgi:RNA polymerase sigma factor (sigma-70 family)
MTNAERTERALGRYADDVWRICLLRCAQKSDAEDAFQDTFLKHLKRAEPFADDGHERAWLLRVAINTCNDQHKRAHRDDEELPAFVAAPGGDGPGTRMADVIEAMRALPCDQRTALYLTAVAGYSAEETARMLDSTSGTVYSWVSRARAKLKEALA